MISILPVVAKKKSHPHFVIQYSVHEFIMKTYACKKTLTNHKAKNEELEKAIINFKPTTEHF